jgi:hypothetical protein
MLNPNIGYANGFSCDSWYFFGLQFNFHDIHRLGSFYQTFRFPALVPWIFLADRIPYDALNLMRFFTYLAIACAGCLWVNARLFGPRVAACIAVVFCCSSGWLGVLSHDYVTAAGVAWTSVLLGATVEAGHSRAPLGWGVVAGLLYGMCLLTHIPIVFFIFAVPLLYFAVPGQTGPIGGFLRYAAGSLVGFLVMIAVCGLYNWSLGGAFFFLGPEIQYAFSLTKDASLSAGFRIAGLDWLVTNSTPLVMELGVLASVLALVIPGPADKAARITALAYLATAAVTLGWELSGRILLQTNVYAPWVFPLLWAAFGASLSRVTAIRQMSWPVLAGVLLVIAGVLLFAVTRDVSLVPGSRLLTLQLVSGLTFVAALLVSYRWKAGPVAALALALFTAVNYPSGYGSFPWLSYGYRGRDMAVQAAQAVQHIDDLHLGAIPAFWVNASSPETTAIPRSFLNCGSFATSFPLLTRRPGYESLFLPLSAETIGTSRTLVVVAPGGNVAAQAAQPLRVLGFDSSSVGEWHIESGALSNTMSVLRLTPAAGGAEPSHVAATFVGLDTTTQGNWRGRYGVEGHSLAGGTPVAPGESQATVTGAQIATWQAATADERALQHATDDGRSAASWFTAGSLAVEVNLNDGAFHRVALYGVDWDRQARDERIDVVDTLTGQLLDTRMLSEFTAGKYLVWSVRGNVMFVVTLTGGANAVISGLFIDSAGDSRPSGGT